MSSRVIGATGRVYLLSAAMLGASGLLVDSGLLADVPDGQLRVPLFGMVLAFAVAGLLVFHVEVRQEAHSFSFSEIPLVLGLFFLDPATLVLARVVGELSVLVFHPRQRPEKVAFNAAVIVSESAVALAVFQLVFGAPDVRLATGWVAALGSVMAADLMSAMAVTAVIHWHGGMLDVGAVVVAATFSAIGNCSIAIIAALLIVDNPAALAVLAVLAGVVYVAYRGYASLSQRYANLHLLYDFTDAIGGLADPRDIMEAILAYARDLLRADVAEITLFGEGDVETVRFVTRGDAPMTSASTAEELAGMLASTVEHRRSLVAPRGAKSANVQQFLGALEAKDAVIVPLSTDGRIVGSIVVADRLGEISTFDEEDGRLFEALGNHASIALENGRLIEVLRTEVERRQHQALHDALTGLPNRIFFTDQCDEVIAGSRVHGSDVGVLLMDLDRFKEINDTLGHQIGDELLQELGRRLRGSAPDNATVARLGGDEFAVLVPHIDSTEEAVTCAHTLREVFAQPVRVGDIDMMVEVSIGVAIWPDHGADATALLQRADIAMYAAKSNAAGVALYSSETDHYTPRRLALAGELRDAIAHGGLEVHYQPKASLRDGRIVGAEALVRWNHHEHGFVSPAEFIPLAERTDLIGPLTMFVLEAATTQCEFWNARGDEMSVSVNVAVRSLLDPQFLDRVLDVVRSSGVNPNWITLEITESGIMSDTTRAIDTLDRLASAGIKLSVDDFGTGYSSLAYLQRLPVHEVKIDRSFVFNAGTDAGDEAIVRSIVDLGHSLGLEVVAEGVEDQLTWDRLAVVGCDVVQGYYLSRPIPPDRFSQWLDDRAGLRIDRRAISGLATGRS